MANIIVVGSINMDVVAQAERLPRPGETLLGSSLRFVPGGKGSNQAVAASRLGGRVALVGKLGRDTFGDVLMDFLGAEQLDLRYMTFSQAAATGTALIVVDQRSENTIVVIPGSNAELTTDDVDAVDFKPGDIVLCQFEIPLEVVQHTFDRARAAGGITVLNAAPALRCPLELLTRVDFLVVNESELAFLAGTDMIPQTPEETATKARRIRAFAEQTVIVTLGARGAICVHNEDVFTVAGHRVKTVDTTGAGDCFVGALAAAMAEGLPLADGMRFANAAAALSTQREGAAVALPTRAEVESFMNAR